MAIIFYITNYITKVKDLVWKRAAIAIKLFHNLNKLIIEYRVKTVDSYKKKISKIKYSSS